MKKYLVAALACTTLFATGGASAQAEDAQLIPAIASTNAIISGPSLAVYLSHLNADRLPSPTAACCNEAFKIATSTNPYLQNYMSVVTNIALRFLR